MRVAGPILLLALSACAASGPTASAPEESSAGRAASQPWERDPFTQTSLIEIDGKPVGYLVEYQTIPMAEDVERALPTGSYRIQARDFEDVGFITPRGEVCRYVGRGTESLGSWSLDKGLLVFFGGGMRTRITVLEPTQLKPATPTTGEGEAPAPGAEKGAEKSDGASEEKAAGGS